MGIRRFKAIRKGVAINFLYYDPTTNQSTFRQGRVESVKRARKTNKKLIVFTIFDKNRNDYRSFHYNRMHLINVG